MTACCQKKNYYFLKTILSEINNYDIISYDIFDTLLLREYLHPQDVFKQLAEYAESTYGIKDFNVVRSYTENEIRTQRQVNGETEDITFDDIYKAISLRYPEYPVNELKKEELLIEQQCLVCNPLAKQLFDASVAAGKQVLLITDMYLPKKVVEDLLCRCGYKGWSDIYISGEIGKQKATGGMYGYLIEKYGLDAAKWLHIGDNPHSDVNVPRTFGITAGFLRNPRDWFFMEREEERLKAQTETGAFFSAPQDDSISASENTAKDINIRFTQCLAPESDIAIAAENITMVFNMSGEKIDNLKEYIIRFFKRQLEIKKFNALSDVTIKVNRGEKVGLIGLNGSGKSTMLKIVSGVLKPTSGMVSVKGSIAPMIELGAGFDYELSARENIYLNGAILGYTHGQMDEYYDGIIEFSELQDFQDIAIKNFSSGMIARLGFAIATCRVPDILIIDEILSVGDFEFQKKCHARMDVLTGQGATVMFVSHSAADVINMCDRAVWLEHGRIVGDGEAQYIVEKYLSAHK